MSASDQVVGDIELVAIPRYAPSGLFGHCTANLLWAHLHAKQPRQGKTLQPLLPYRL